VSRRARDANLIQHCRYNRTLAVIDKFWRDRSGRAVIVRLIEFNGHALIDIRTHATAPDCTFRPAKGFACGVRFLPVHPVGVIVDNVAATFGGQQNDRGMARSYVNLWRTIARGPSRPAVILIDHPSLSGLTNGTGRGGSVDWWNALRCVNYLYPSDEQAEADRGIRILETKKSNYGPHGKTTQALPAPPLLPP
jgi:hypothetical protein